MKFQQDTVKPTALHCLDCTWYQHCYQYLLLLLLTPFRFPQQLLRYFIKIQWCNYFIRFCANERVNLIQDLFNFKEKECKVNLISSSVYGRFQLHTSMSCTTRILWTILHVGISNSNKLDCTDRTLWICLNRIWLFRTIIESQ